MRFYLWLVSKAHRGNILIAFSATSFINISLFMLGNWAGYGQKTLLDGSAVLPLDVLFGYDSDTVYTQLEAYGELGRTAYLISAAGIDMIYPIAYSFLLSFLLVVLLQNSFPEKVNKLFWLSFLPFLMAVFDYTENTCFVIFTCSFPERTDYLVGFASLITQSKWLSAILIFFLLIFGFIYWVLSRKEPKN